MKTHTTNDENGKTLYHETYDCGRCGGSGWFHFTRMGHPVKGVCFKCEGACTLTKTFKTSGEHRAKLAAKRQAKAEAAARLSLPVRLLNRLAEKIAADFAAKAEETAKQAERDSWNDVVAGKREVTGTVLGGKFVESQYGTTTKVLIELDTREKVWGSLPGKVESAFHAWLDSRPMDEENPGLLPWVKGRRLSFSATFEISDRDEKFGFYKRPTKAKLLAA